MKIFIFSDEGGSVNFVLEGPVDADMTALKEEFIALTPNWKRMTSFHYYFTNWLLAADKGFRELFGWEQY